MMACAQMGPRTAELLRVKHALHSADAPRLAACTCVMQAAHVVETAAFAVHAAAHDAALAARVRARLAAAFAAEYRSVLPSARADRELRLALCPAAVLLARAGAAVAEHQYAQAVSLLTWAAAAADTLPRDAVLYARAQAYFDFGYDAVCSPLLPLPLPPLIAASAMVRFPHRFSRFSRFTS